MPLMISIASNYHKDSLGKTTPQTAFFSFFSCSTDLPRNSEPRMESQNNWGFAKMKTPGCLAVVPKITKQEATIEFFCRSYRG